MKLVYPAISLDHTNPVTNKNLISNYLIKTFNQLGVESEIVFYKSNFIKYLFVLPYYYYKCVKKQNYIISRAPKLLKLFSRKINAQINNSDADFIFAFGTNPIGYLETNKPIYIIADSTFHNLLDRYDDYCNLPRKYVTETNILEQMAFTKATKIFFASKFAVEDAINYYGVSPEKIIQVPLGANIDNIPTEDEIQSIIDKKLNQSLQLLMIGREWKRKGIDIGIKIYRAVKENVKDCHLTIIGCNVPKGADVSDITLIRSIDKSNHHDSNLLNTILKQTHFLLFPSRAEAFGHVIAESNAFGIPVIASDVGGIPSAIGNGINGYTINLNNENGIDFAINKIVELYNSKSLYKELSINSYKTYSSKLNWNTIVKTIIETIETTIEHR